VPDVLIRDVAEPVVGLLKQRHALHRRSLQRELTNSLDAAVHVPFAQKTAEITAAIRTRPGRGGRAFSDSTPLIRANRSP